MLLPGESFYLLGLLPLEGLASWALPALAGDRLPFLPLMVTSVYCACGLGWVWFSEAHGYYKKQVAGAAAAGAKKKDD